VTTATTSLDIIVKLFENQSTRLFEFFLLQSFQILQTGTPQKQELNANDNIDVVGALFKQMPSNPIIAETVKNEFKNLYSSYGYV
jgi:hypothetical protein